MSTSTAFDPRLHDQPDVIDTAVLVDAGGYAAHGYPYDAWAALRRESPVHWCAPPGFRPFWAVTRHEHVRHVSTHPDLFRSEPRTILFPELLEAMTGVMTPRTLINMDPPEHRYYRVLAAPFLKPCAIRSL